MKNYQILPDKYSDADKGYEIQNKKRTFISWDLPVKEMLDKHQDLLNINEHGVVNFKHSVRIGNMIFQNFGTGYNDNQDPRPFITFHAACENTQQELHGFDEIYQNLLNQYQEPADTHFVKKYGLLNSAFKFSGIRLVIYKPNIQVYRDVRVRLVWFNDREYPYLLDNFDYERKMKISAYFILEEPKLSLAQGYFSNLNIKNNPPLIKERFGNKTVIWRDDVNKVLGFSKEDKAHIYSFDEISHISIRNIDDGRIGFYSELNVHLSNKITTLFYSGDPGKVIFFDHFVDEIKEVTQYENISISEVP